MIPDDLLPPAPAWWRWAACRGLGCVVMFPERGEATGPAREVCRTCPTRPACITANIGEKVGVWGGLSEHERRALRRDGEVTTTAGDVVMWAPGEAIVIPSSPTPDRHDARARAVKHARVIVARRAERLEAVPA